MPSKKTNHRRIVIKVGGSLLSQPRFVDRFESWFTKLHKVNPNRIFILLVGGGAPVEGLRLIDQANHLDESLCHWLAIKQMDRNAELVNDLLSDWQLSEAASIENFTEPTQTIIAPYNFLLHEEPNHPGKKLTIGWQTTSDAIATRLAGCLDAELILLKSTDPPRGIDSDDWNSLAKKGYIDSATPELMEEVVIRRVEKLPLA